MTPMRLAVGTAVVATLDRQPSVIVGLIVPLDDDLLFNTDQAITLAARIASHLGKTGNAAVFLSGFHHLDPGTDLDEPT